jgi:prophage antirepressor-like protein
MEELTDKIYKEIPKSKNIILTLLKSLNDNKLFQSQVKKLSVSDKQTERKKSEAITNTIHNIKVFNTKTKPLFLAKDIGILMGISQINYLIRKFEPEEKIIGYITKNNKTKKVIFLTRHGIYSCFFASRSPLAKLFKKFICNLIDHMVENESEIIEKLSIKFQTENPKLIEQGIKDLENKSIELEQKYIEERQKSQLLEEQCIDEQNKRLETEDEKTELDILNSYNMMHIQQLKKDKDQYITHIKTIKENIVLEDSESINLMELRLLKEKFMKPMYVYILHPDHFKKLLKHKIRDDEKETADEKEIQDSDSDKHDSIPISDKIYQTDIMKQIVADDTYKTNFDNIFSKDEIYIELDEILYLCFSFARNVAKKDKLILINTQWVANKKHFLGVMESLNKNSDNISLNKHHLFKTSLEEIGDVVREEFITLS